MNRLIIFSCLILFSLTLPYCHSSPISSTYSSSSSDSIIYHDQLSPLSNYVTGNIYSSPTSPPHLVEHPYHSAPVHIPISHTSSSSKSSNHRNYQYQTAGYRPSTYSSLPYGTSSSSKYHVQDVDLSPPGNISDFVSTGRTNNVDGSSSSSAYDTISFAARPIILKGAYEFTTSLLMESIYLQYSTLRHDIFLTGNQMTQTQILNSAKNNELDFMVSTELLTEEDKQNMPDLLSFPLGAIGTVFVSSMTGVANDQLTFSVPVACNILRGNITRWNDPAIKALNPEVTLPNLGINMVFPSVSTGCALALTLACNKISPEFTSIVGTPTGKPTWPNSRFYSVQYGVDLADAISIAARTPFSLSFTFFGQAFLASVTRIAMMNPYGARVKASAASLAFALSDLLMGANNNTGVVKSEARVDLTMAPGAHAWPFGTTAMVYLQRTLMRTNCVAKAELAKFWLWIIQSSAAKYVARVQAAVLLPDYMSNALKVKEVLINQLLCEHVQINSARKGLQTIYGAEVISPTSRMLPFFLAAYGADDPLFDYIYKHMDEKEAVLRVTSGEARMAVVQPDTFKKQYPGTLENVTSITTGNLELYPFAVYSLLPTFKFPTGVETMRSNKNDQPIVLDLETLALIWTGEIISWTDSRIEKFNPGLSYLFQNSSSTTTIQLVMCCAAADTDQTITNSFFLTLNKTKAFQSSGLPPFNVPMDWTPYLNRYKSKGIDYRIIDDEIQLESALSSIDGGLSYRLLDESVSRPAKDMSIVVSLGDGSKKIISGGSDAALICVNQLPADMINLNVIDLAASEEGMVNGCWPFLSYQGLLLPRKNFGQPCLAAKHMLEIARTIMTSNKLGLSSLSKGMVPFMHNVKMAELLKTTIEQTTCDGTTMLIVLPDYWKLSPVISSLGLSFSVVSYIICLFSLYLYKKFSHKAIIRSASLPFSLFMVFGLFVFMSSPMIMSLGVSDGLCSANFWIMMTGFSMRFSPLFVKMYRIYMIFGRRQLKVIRLSNAKLGLGVVILLLIELILLIALQIVSPMKVGYINESKLDGHVTKYATCTFDREAYPLLGILLSWKLGLLLFGGFVGFKTRNVASQFNESKNLALSLYCVLISLSVLIGLIFLMNPKGDQFVALLMIVVFLIGLSSWCFTCLSKFLILWEDVKAQKSIDSQGHGMTPTSGDNGAKFDFPSAASMDSVKMIEKYIYVLERQLILAKRRMIADGKGIGTGTTALKNTLQKMRSGRDANNSRLNRASSFYESGMNNESGLWSQAGDDSEDSVNSSYGADNSQVLGQAVKRGLESNDSKVQPPSRVVSLSFSVSGTQLMNGSSAAASPAAGAGASAGGAGHIPFRPSSRAMSNSNFNH